MVNVYFTPELLAKPDLAAVNRCLEPLLGKAREIETDYAARRVEYDWRGRAGFPRVYATHQLLMIFHDAFGSEPTRNSEWNRVFARLGECGSGS